jgi:hypothetical protein
MDTLATKQYKKYQPSDEQGSEINGNCENTETLG